MRPRQTNAPTENAMQRNPFMVAEMSGSHLGSYARAAEIVEAAANAGADACKLQVYSPEQMADGDTIIEAGPWAGQNLQELYKESHTPREWVPDLFSLIRMRRMVPFASVFHPDDVDFLMTLDCGILKISSFELTDLVLIRHAARTGKPLIISTGMGTEQEIKAAMLAATQNRCSDLTLLKCTSSYPADASDANLAAMVRMGGWLNYPAVGLSDHTPGIGVAVAATTLGASVIEKHLTLNRADGGPDAAFSLEPAEFAQLVIECRRAAAAIGEVRYGPTSSEASSMPLRRKPGGKRG